MPVQRIDIEAFLALAEKHPVLDVRSPGEYAQAHIPSAYSLPLFSDEERKTVGTIYKQQDREKAIKTGLDFFGAKMRKMIEDAENIFSYAKNVFKDNNTNDHKRVLLAYCWRGGMRSAGVAWLLDIYGFTVYTLAGGYKSYRRWVLKQFEKKYPFHLLGGYTGSGKTQTLQNLFQKGHLVIDLESIASHKGSAFGGLGLPQQPRQEMFENILALRLSAAKDAQIIWLEDESQRIGNLNIPNPIWEQMRQSPVTFINIDFEERLNFITADYGKFEKEQLVNAIIRIQKRLGGLETKMAINFLLENNHKECFRILLNYYDKQYDKSLQNRPQLKQHVHRLDFGSMDIDKISRRLLYE